MMETIPEHAVHEHNRLKVIDLFSGIGGFSLGLERAGFETIAFCEIEPFPRAVLAKHWPKVPIYDDIRTLTAARLAADGLVPDVICGGSPCQDISLAGRGVGLGGERSGLWREYARLIGEIRPRYVVIENVAALRSRGLDQVLGEVSALGYDAEWNCIPAAAIGAPHRRDRVWIVAYPNGDGRGRYQPQRCPDQRNTDISGDGAGWDSDRCADVAYPEQRAGIVRHKTNLQRGRSDDAKQAGRGGGDLANATQGRRGVHGHVCVSRGGAPAGQPTLGGETLADRGGAGLPGTEQPAGRQPLITPADIRRAIAQCSWRRAESRMGRTFDGISEGVDRTRPVEAWEEGTPRTVGRGSINRRPRLMALGNGIVPQIAELIGRAILRKESP